MPETVVTVAVAGGWNCDQVRAAWKNELPAGFRWAGLGASGIEGLWQAFKTATGVGPPMEAAVLLANGAGLDVTVALWRRVINEGDGDPPQPVGDCNRGFAQVVTGSVVEPVVAAAGKVALTLLLVAAGVGIAMLGLRQLAAPATPPTESA